MTYNKLHILTAYILISLMHAYISEAITIIKTVNLPISPKVSLSPFELSLTLPFSFPHPWTNLWSAFCQYTLICVSCNFKNLDSFTQHNQRFTHVVANTHSSFFVNANECSILWIYQNFLLYPFTC